MYNVFMSQIRIISFFSLVSIFSFFWSLLPYTYFTPQLLALLSVLIMIILLRKNYFLFVLLVTCFVLLLIFSTNGVTSPFFFLSYFLLFLIAFQYQPLTSLIVSIVNLVLLSQSLNSLASLLPLVSLLFISPFAWFISRQRQSQSLEETDFLLWLNLKFKTGIKVIINSTRDPEPDIKKIRSSATSLLNSADKLTHDLQDDL